MADRAVWRAAPGDPRTGLGWFLADERPRGIPAWLGAVGAIVVGSLAAGSFLDVGLIAALGLAFLPLIALSVKRRHAPRDLSFWKTSPSPGPSFECRIEVRTEAAPFTKATLMGVDEGILTFVDGWLYYAGARTEFALRRGDVPNVYSDGRRHTLSLEDATELFIELRDERDVEHAGRAFLFWRNRVPEPSGASTLPPLTVHPTGLARAWRDAASAAAWIAAISVLLYGVWQTLPVFAFWWFGGGTFTAFRRLVRVRRLSRGTKGRPSLNDSRLPIGR